MIDFFVKGGFMMIPMLLVSVAAVAFMIERGIALRKKQILPTSVLDALQIYQNDGNLKKLQQQLCVPDEGQTQPRSSASALGRLVSCAIAHLSSSRENVQEAIENQARKEMLILDKWLVFLEIIVGIAPLMGLLGTLHGMINLFGGLGASFGAADPALIAAGISVTLNVTFMGLAIAVPSLVAWSFYSRKVEVLTT